MSRRFHNHHRTPLFTGMVCLLPETETCERDHSDGNTLCAPSLAGDFPVERGLAGSALVAACGTCRLWRKPANGATRCGTFFQQAFDDEGLSLFAAHARSGGTDPQNVVEGDAATERSTWELFV